jgi:GT2 family glycosyltransferase
MKKINVLIPTYKRTCALAVTLTSLAFQTEKSFDIIISDQTPDDSNEKDFSIQTAILLLRSKGHEVFYFKNLPPKGLAHQREFLLEKSSGEYSLYLDDDLILEPWVIRNLRRVLEEEECGFAGNAVIGLSYQNDIRPHQHTIELWHSKVIPEYIIPKSIEWERYVIHNAANLLHIQDNLQITPDVPVPYKVAWVGGCVLYDTHKLKDVGGFSFWKDLPEKHCGEDVLAQLRVMKRYGGCGVLPSGVYHQELETTVPDRKVNAPEVLEI